MNVKIGDFQGSGGYRYGRGIKEGVGDSDKNVIYIYGIVKEIY